MWFRGPDRHQEAFEDVVDDAPTSSPPWPDPHPDPKLTRWAAHAPGRANRGWGRAGRVGGRFPGIEGPLLAPRATDEYAPVPPGPAQRRAARTVAGAATRTRRASTWRRPTTWRGRLGTAATLRALDAEHGGGFFDIPAEAESDPAAADECFAALGPVVDVQTHLVRPSRDHHRQRRRAHGLPPDGRARALGDPIDPDHLSAPAWASCVFAGSETSVALLTSPPGVEGRGGDRQRRHRRRPRGGRPLRRHRPGAHPHDRPPEPAATRRARADGRVVDPAAPGGLEGVHALGPAGGPDRRLVPRRRPRRGLPRPGQRGRPADRVRPQGPRRADPVAGPGGGLTARHRSGGRSPTPTSTSSCTTPATTSTPATRRAPTTPTRSAASAGSSPASPTPASGRAPTCGPSSARPGRWCCAARSRPPTCIGKLLLAVGEDRILWGTDSVWYGPPQPLIDAFRAFTIPERLREDARLPRRSRRR